MIRVTVSYPSAADATFDHAYYGKQHKDLIEQRLKAFGLIGVEIDKALADGAGGPPPHIAAAHLLFENMDGFQKGMAEHGGEITADVKNYTNIVPQITVSETAR